MYLRSAGARRLVVVTLVFGTLGPPTAQALAAPALRALPVTDHVTHGDRTGHGRLAGDTVQARQARKATKAGHTRGAGQARKATRAPEASAAPQARGARQVPEARQARGEGQTPGARHALDAARVWQVRRGRGGGWQVTSGVRSANSPQIGSPVRQVSRGRRNVNAPGGNSGSAVAGLQQVAGDSVVLNTLNGGCLPTVVHCGINQSLRSGGR
ncbi:hypothetical protein F5972_01900 [Microbispora cellulosiformans]|uniref:Uncharacterized protein n=1 Tax=Microbispora cellulosiformans TaxID=2614688 RepID=A0A5J5KC97_9ACTN|nr:hypothetical protein [Microbispora cellulosiformans]KAA9381609.1 hypothetical protein F5972_01900 [Microbispora cellulosiformans]